MTQRLSLIWAMSRNRVIGKHGRLPWDLPDEMAHFRRTTQGKPVIMGRRTFESAGGPLPGRLNIVLSRRGEFRAPGARRAADLETALAIAAEDPADECFVTGGVEPYALALPRADRLYATTVEAEVDGDVFFPCFALRDWRLARETFRPADARHRFAYTVRTYIRRPTPAAGPASAVLT